MKASCDRTGHSLKECELKAKPRKPTGQAPQCSAGIWGRGLEEGPGRSLGRRARPGGVAVAPPVD